MIDNELMQLSEQVGQVSKARGVIVTTAGSRTDGWVAKVIIDIADNSAWFEHEPVTYSNEAKTQMIDVHEETLVQHGAMSEPVVVGIAIGTLKMARAGYAMSISGIAKSSGGSEEKLADTVWFAFTTARGGGITRWECSNGDRDAMRRQATAYALQTLWQQFL